MSGEGFCPAGTRIRQRPYDSDMSAARVLYPYPPFPSMVGLKMTAEEYLALGESSERTELLNGVVVSMSPSPIPRHFKVIHELLIQLGRA